MLRWFVPVLLTPALYGQTEQPTIRVTTRMVDVSVVARNKIGPATGLTAGDFRLFDNGEERKIAFFSMSTVRPPARPAPAIPNLYTNRAENRSDAAGRLTILLVDGFNSSFADQARTRQQLLKFIAAIQPRDRIAICVLGTSIRVLHDFTNDRRELEKSVGRYWGNLEQIPESTVGASAELSGTAAFNAATDATIETMMRSYRGHVTADLLKQFGTQLARVPGRKSLIWLSTGFPIQLIPAGSAQPQEYLSVEAWNATAQALGQGNIAVYPVDTAGLVTPGGAGSGFADVGPGGSNRHLAMDILAEVTGGRPFYNRNDIDQEVREAFEDSEVTYTLGFYPGSSGQDGGFHRLQIQTGRPGVELRYRQSYQAANALLPADELDGREQIHDALQSPVESTGIIINLRVEKPNPKKANSLRMTIAVALPELVGSTIDLIVSQRAADGSDVITLGDPVKIERKEDLLLHREIEVRPKAVTIRVIVFDRTSGRLGSLEIPAH